MCENDNLYVQRDKCTCDDRDIESIKSCPYCHQVAKDGTQACCFNVACKDRGE